MSSNVTLNSETTVQTLHDYCGVDISIEDLANMSSDELVALLEKAFNDAHLTEDQISNLKSELQDELDGYYSQASEYKKDLQSMVDSGSSAALQDTYSLWIDRLDELMTLLSDDIGNTVDDALKEVTEKHIEANAGDSTSVSFDDPQNGDEYFIAFDDTATDLSSGSVFNSETNKGWLDLNHDGYRETNPDMNNDGIADKDFDGDGAITEADLTFQTQTTYNTVELPATDSSGSKLTYSYESYDAATQTVKLKVINEEGKVFYLTVEKGTKFTGGVPVNYASMPDDLQAMWYETSSAEHSIYFFTHGVDPNDTGVYYSNYDMADYDDGLTVDVSDEDFVQGRSYTFDLSDGHADNLDLNLPDGAEMTGLTFDSATNTATMTFTTPEGTITVTLKGLSPDDMYAGTDVISINNAKMTSEAAQNLKDIMSAGSITLEGFIFQTLQFDDETLYEAAMAM